MGRRMADRSFFCERKLSVSLEKGISIHTYALTPTTRSLPTLGNRSYSNRQTRPLKIFNPPSPLLPFSYSGYNVLHMPHSPSHLSHVSLALGGWRCIFLLPSPILQRRAASPAAILRRRSTSDDAIRDVMLPVSLSSRLGLSFVPRPISFPLFLFLFHRGSKIGTSVFMKCDLPPLHLSPALPQSLPHPHSSFLSFIKPFSYPFPPFHRLPRPLPSSASSSPPLRAPRRPAPPPDSPPPPSPESS